MSARHALRVAPGRTDLARGALLHDIGKRHARLGLAGRSLAGAVRALGLPSWGRVRRYLEHGEIGASELEAAGAEPLVVGYARHHHDPVPPPEVTRGDWEVLVAADHARR